jgi:hypothetical protein
MPIKVSYMLAWTRQEVLLYSRPGSSVSGLACTPIFKDGLAGPARAGRNAGPSKAAAARAPVVFRWVRLVSAILSSPGEGAGIEHGRTRPEREKLNIRMIAIV